MARVERNDAGDGAGEANETVGAGARRGAAVVVAVAVAVLGAEPRREAGGELL